MKGYSFFLNTCTTINTSYKYLMLSSRTNKYCCEDLSLIENYDKAINDEKQIWHIHHRLETDRNITRQQLIDKNLYWNRPACELIFLTHKDHSYLHCIHQSEETKHKIKLNHSNVKGENNPMYKKHHSEETKRKQSDRNKGKTPWNKGVKGYHRVYDNEERTKWHMEY